MISALMYEETKKAYNRRVPRLTISLNPDSPRIQRILEAEERWTEACKKGEHRYGDVNENLREMIFLLFKNPNMSVNDIIEEIQKGGDNA